MIDNIKFRTYNQHVRIYCDVIYPQEHATFYYLFRLKVIEENR